MKRIYVLFFTLIALTSCKKGNDPVPDPIIGPTITKINPIYGGYNTVVVIEGTGFSTVADENIVKFNGQQAVIEIAESNSLAVKVPLECGTGEVTVTVNSKTATGPVFNYISGEVTTIAGSGSGIIQNGPALSAGFLVPQYIARDKVGNIYVAEDAPAIRKISADGQVTFFAGDNRGVGHKDGVGTDAIFHSPQGMVCDDAGNLFVADIYTIRKISPQGVVTTFAGVYQEPGYVDGNLADARFSGILDIKMDKNGNIYVCDNGNYRIRKITPEGIVSTFAGNGESGFADGPALSAKFYTLEHICVDDDGNVYVADTRNQRIRKITPAGIVSTLAGSGANSYRDGPGNIADFANPSGVVADKDGNIYVSDNYGLIRRVDALGNVITVAGTHDQTGYTDGALYAAKFYNPLDITIDDNGALYIADAFNKRIRKVVFK
jgi:streptogramin lyase